MYKIDDDAFGTEFGVEPERERVFINSSIPNYLKNLNPQQEEAVKTIYGPLLILAGAGTGKTKTVTSRMIHLITQQYAEPRQILGLTFTNKAAREMLERVEAQTDASDMWLGTFHSTCARLLRIHYQHAQLDQKFVIVDQSESEQILNTVIKELDIETDAPTRKIIRKIISDLKEKCKDYTDHIPPALYLKINNQFPLIYQAYQQSLQRSNLLDFDDLIFKVIKMMEQRPEVVRGLRQQFQFVFVDEYQDTSSSQNCLVKLLCGQSGNICCVGDEDQSIYSWRGAQVENILNFQKDFGSTKIIRLEKNYRSTKHIVDVAMSVISNNKTRYSKTLEATIGLGSQVTIHFAKDDRQECRNIINKIRRLNDEGIAFNNMAILVRASFQNRLLEEFFNSACLPYRVIDGVKFYDRKEIKDIIAYLRLIAFPLDESAFERIVNLPKRGIGPKKVDEIKAYARTHSINLIEAIKQMSANGELTPKVAEQASKFANQISSWNADLDESTILLSTLAEQVVQQTGYMEMLREEGEKEGSEENTIRDRIENIKELISSLSDFASLQEFLEHIALLNAKQTDNEGDAVNIMTMHAAKGLEFDAVFSLGWEENLFPSSKSLQHFNPEVAIEEERRLAYVTITRAKQYLMLSCALSRLIFGRIQSNQPSRFLMEIKKNAPEDSYSILHDSPEASIANITGFRKNIGDSLNPSETNLKTRRNWNSIPINSSIGSINADSNATSITYQSGDKVNHNIFGDGTVQKTMSHYAEVLFTKTGNRMLIHTKFLAKQ